MCWSIARVMVDEIEPCSVGKVATTSSVKGVPRGSGMKQTRTNGSSSNNSKGKRRKSTMAKHSDRDNTKDAGDGTPRDVESGNNLAVPLTRGDIPTIVYMVLQSIRSPHILEDNEPILQSY